MSKTIMKRRNLNKKLVVEQLKKTPVIQVVCEKLNIGRASYYRWRQEDRKFAENADKALLEGKQLVNDLAESRLIGAINNSNLSAIFFWLRSHHYSYANKVEIDAKLKIDKETLTAKQENLVKNALDLAGLLTANQKKGENKNES